MTRPLTLSPIRSRRARELVTEQVCRLLLDRALRPGDRLPPERELRERLGVGRSTIREALMALAARGILDIQQGRGVFVTRVPAAVLVERLRGPADGTSALEDVWTIREALETRAAMLAAERRTAHDLDRLGRAVGEMDQAVARGESGEREDARFHDTLVRASRSALLQLMLQDVAALVAEARRRALQTPGRPRTSTVEHRAILDAVRARDPGLAGSRMFDHLSFGRNVTTAPQPAGRSEVRRS